MLGHMEEALGRRSNTFICPRRLGIASPFVAIRYVSRSINGIFTRALAAPKTELTLGANQPQGPRGAAMCFGVSMQAGGGRSGRYSAHCARSET